MPPHSITTLSLIPPHTTPHHSTHCAVVLFACHCLCVSLSARSFLTQLKPHHAIQSPHPPHMAPQMHEPMSELERAMRVWTPQPKHQPPQPSHDATHTTCSLSFHPLAIRTLHNTATPNAHTMRREGGKRAKSVGTRKGVPLLCAFFDISQNTHLLASEKE